MKRFLALLGAVALAAGATIFSGCAIMPVYEVVPGLNFVHDELIVHLGASVHQVVKGIRGASYQLQLAPVEEITTPTDAKLIAYDPHGSRIVIRLIPVSDQVTQVRIKAGIFGDEGYSRRILADIQKNLP